MQPDSLNGKYTLANCVVKGEGRPVVLIHGTGASLHHWDFLIPELVRAGFRCCALDLLGHGDSAKPGEKEAYHIEEIYGHAEHWMDSLDISEPFDLVAHSMGGFVGLNYALRHPGRVRRMALIDPFYSPRQTSKLIKLATRRPHVSLKVIQAAPKWLVKPAVKLNRNIAHKGDADTVTRLTMDLGRADPNIIYITHTTWDLSPQLSAVQSEALVMWGEKDRTLAPRSFPRMVRRIPHAQGHPIPGAGHTPHLTHANIVNEQVVGFLAPKPHPAP